MNNILHIIWEILIFISACIIAIDSINWIIKTIYKRRILKQATEILKNANVKSTDVK